MRFIDTAALQAVARSLGVGNPATARAPVVFDDGNLQQIWDATKFARFPTVRGILDLEVAAGASATARQDVTYQSLFASSRPYFAELQEKGFDQATSDVWIERVQMGVMLTEEPNLEEATLSTELEGTQDPPLLLERVNFGQASAVAIATNLFVPAGTTGSGLPPLLTRYPIKLDTAPTTEVLALRVTATAGGQATVKAQVVLRFVIRGTPIWYEI